MTNLLTRNSPRELTTPIPTKDEMHEIYQAALRAPDHAWLRPTRFIEVKGSGLEKLSNVFVEFASKEFKDLTPPKWRNMNPRRLGRHDYHSCHSNY